jgi:tetratricopeptide (TPR) repeat protein
MLHTVRAYAADRLRASGEEDLLWDRLADYLIRLAEEAEPGLVGPEADLRLGRLAAEHDNIRAVLRRFLDQREHERVLRLGSALARFWQRRGHYLEGYAWLTEALMGSGEETSGRLHARAMHGAGSLAATCGDFASATVWFARALEIWRALDDTANVAGSLNNLAVIAQEQGDYDRARILYEEALPLHRLENDLRGIACALNNLGIVELESGDPARAASLYEQALPYFRQIGWEHGMAAALTNMAILARRAGDLDRSESLAGEALALHRRMGDPKGIATALSTLGNASLDRDDLESARAYYEEAITIAGNSGDRELPISALEDLATVAHRQGAPLRAAQLLGAAEALSLAVGHPINPAAISAHESLVASLRQALGPACFDAAWAEGRRMDLHEAVERATSRSG